MLADGYGNQLILQGNSDEKTSFVVVENTVKKTTTCFKDCGLHSQKY